MCLFTLISNLLVVLCGRLLLCSFTLTLSNVLVVLSGRLKGGRSSSERSTPGEEVSGSIPAAAARSLLVGLVSWGPSAI